MQTGVIICFILIMHSMLNIEPAYIKAIRIFIVYWSFYLIALSIYYRTLMVEQFFLFSCLFWLIYEIYKENYQLSNSLTEIFYDFHNDPVLLYEEETQSIKVNSMFVNSFGHLIKRRKLFHHSQMLTEILNPHEIVFECLQDGVKKISLEQVLNQQEQMSKKELILRKVEGDKTFMFTFYRLENLYDSKTVCVFKETTHIHELQKVADRVRSVIMGCLTHELRTPVN